MRKLAAYLVTWLVATLTYLALVASKGPLGFWYIQEIIAAIIVGAIVSVICTRFFIRGDLRMLNPKRWFLFLAYAFGPFLVGMIKANFDVAYRVITGKIRPGIVRLKPNLTKPFARTLLANSITLTPGTMTVDIDEEGNYYIHWLYVPEGKERPNPEDVYDGFEKWVRRVAE